MQRECPKCNGSMDGEPQEIPIQVPLPIPLAPKVDLRPYIPKILQQYRYYMIFVCRTCGYVEFFVYNR
jgi:hypothetical protein